MVLELLPIFFSVHFVDSVCTLWLTLVVCKCSLKRCYGNYALAVSTFYFFIYTRSIPCLRPQDIFFLKKCFMYMYELHGILIIALSEGDVDALHGR